MEEKLEQIDEDSQQIRTEVAYEALEDVRQRSVQEEVIQSLFICVFSLEVQRGTMVFEEQVRREEAQAPPTASKPGQST